MLTELEETLADAHALAIAASAVTLKVEERTPSRALVGTLAAMRRDADDTRARCLEAERRLGDERANELLAHVNTAKERASDLANAWFKAGTGPLAAWRFLAMGEAAEVSAWTALELLARRSEAAALVELAEWAVPVQRRHLESALEGAVRLADAGDPHRLRWG